MQVIWVSLLVLAVFGAVFGTLVLLRRARLWEARERKRTALLQLVQRGIGEGGVVLRVDELYCVHLYTADGRLPRAIVHDTGTAEVLAERALTRLRTAIAARPSPVERAAEREDDGPPSGTRRAQLAEAAAADGHVARQLRALQAHADATVAECAQEEQRRADRRRGPPPPVFVPVVRGGNHGGETCDHAS